KMGRTVLIISIFIICLWLLLLTQLCRSPQGYKFQEKQKGVAVYSHTIDAYGFIQDFNNSHLSHWENKNIETECTCKGKHLMVFTQNTFAKADKQNPYTREKSIGLYKELKKLTVSDKIKDLRRKNKYQNDVVRNNYPLVSILAIQYPTYNLAEISIQSWKVSSTAKRINQILKPLKTLPMPIT